MEINTSALCDLYGDQIDVLEPLFSHFGGLPTFAGQIHTVKCFEDSSVIATALAQNGQGKVRC